MIATATQPTADRARDGARRFLFTSSPWGSIQHRTEIAPGIVSVTTAGHGGIWLSPDRQAVVAAAFPGFVPFVGEGAWYEEDCDWAIVALIFHQFFDEGSTIVAAIGTARSSRWVEVVKWLDSPSGNVVRGRAEAWTEANRDAWQPGGMGSSGNGWNVHFRQIGTGDSRRVAMPSFPTQSTYTTEELDAFGK